MATEKMVKEIPPGFLRNDVVARIKNGLPIKIYVRANGDAMINWWTHTIVLMQLCKEEGIDITAEQLPLEIAPLDITRPEAYYLFPRALCSYPYASQLQGRYQVASELTVLSYALGISLDPLNFLVSLLYPFLPTPDH